MVFTCPINWLQCSPVQSIGCSAYLSLVDDVENHVGAFVLQAVTQSGHVWRVVGKAAIRLDYCQRHCHARRPADLTTFVFLQHAYRCTQRQQPDWCYCCLFVLYNILNYRFNGSMIIFQLNMGQPEASDILKESMLQTFDALPNRRQNPTISSTINKQQNKCQ